MSFANHLSSNKCTVSTVDPKPKSGPKTAAAQLVSVLTRVQTKHGFTVSILASFFTRYHSFHAFAHWLFPGGIQAKFGFSFHTQTNKKWLQHQFNDKKIGSDMFYCKQKNIEPTTNQNKFEVISVNFHTRN